MPRSAAARPRRARSRDPARPGRGGSPSGPGRTGSASMKSRRSAVQPGGSYGILDERPATDPGRDVEVGQQPDPVRPGVRAVPAVAGQRELAERPRRGASRPPGRRRAGGRRTRRRRARRASSANVRVISPPAMRIPGADARSAARPGRSVPASGSSSHSTSSSASRTAISRAATGSSERDVSPAIRQPWLRSTMIAIESPTASRVAATAASPSSSRFGSTRILSARKPSSRSRSADSARARPGAAAIPHEA